MRVTIGFGFVSHWKRKWREFRGQPITGRSKLSKAKRQSRPQHYLIQRSTANLPTKYVLLWWGKEGQGKSETQRTTTQQRRARHLFSKRETEPRDLHFVDYFIL